MKAIEVQKWGEAPVFNPSAKSPPTPTSSDQIQVRILAAGLHNLVRSQAAGKHYSTNPATTPVPYIPGSDGVGTTPDGRLVYFSAVGTGGAFADSITLPKSAVILIPGAPTVDINSTDNSTQAAQQTKLAARIAVLFNPAMSSWMALHTRVTPSLLQKEGGFNMLIIGATSLSGQIAIKHARHLGVRKIIGLARNMSALKALDIDIPIKMEEDITSTNLTSVLSDPATKVDIILDYIYGPITAHVLASLPSDPTTAHENPVEYVDIGSLAAPDFTLPAATLRSKNLTLRGAGFGSWSTTKDASTWFPKLLERLCDDTAFSIDQFPTVVQRGLQDVNAAWADTKSRTVFVN